MQRHLGAAAVVLLVATLISGCASPSDSCPLSESEIEEGLGIREIVVSLEDGEEGRYKVCEYFPIDQSEPLAPSFTLFWAPLENMSDVQSLLIGDRVDIGVDAFIRLDDLGEGDNFLDGTQTALSFVHDEYFLEVRWLNRASTEAPIQAMVSVAELVVATGDVPW